MTTFQISDFSEILAVVEAKNGFDALNTYSLQEGFAPYERESADTTADAITAGQLEYTSPIVDRLGEQWVGLWTAPFTNYEIVAIPVCADCGDQMMDDELDSSDPSHCVSCSPIAASRS
jgi:hypothetical protein